MRFVGPVAAGLAFSLLGVLPGLGLPGAVATEAALPLIQAIWPAAEPFPQDSAWPFAILVTLAWGPAVPLAWFATARLRGVIRGVAMGGAVLAAGPLLALALYALTMPRA